MATLLSSLETQVRRHLMEAAALLTPGAITVTPQGTGGAATWTYKLVAIGPNGTTEAGAASSTAVGNATLSVTNYNRLTWSAVASATGYWIYRTAVGSSPSTTGRITILGAVTTYDDIGGAGDSAIAPVTNTTGLSNPFWTSAELLDMMNHGIKDLWGACADLHQDHWFTNDETNVSMAALTSTLTGVPTDVFRVLLIEPRDVSSTATGRNTYFRPKPFNSTEMVSARSATAGTADGQVIYYSVSQAGAPVGAPTIHVAPQLSAALLLRLVYIPIQAAVAAGGTNPVPGESDQALVAWTVAYARGKQTEGGSPDPNWLAIYANEKQSMLTRLTPRQEQEPEEVEGLFEGYN